MEGVNQDGISNDRKFTIDPTKNCFLKDGHVFQYISGGMHYFRIPRCYWKDRLHKARLMGLNTIETYIPWNIHQPQPDAPLDFSDEKDLLHFMDLAQEENLLVILRPGPYIDAEWDFGALPWWLAKDRTIKMRTSESESYVQAVIQWYRSLFDPLRKYLYQNGGPVIAFQIENEYGNYHTCDSVYLKRIYEEFRSFVGEDFVLFSVDSYREEELRTGTLPELFTTVDFGTEIEPIEAFKMQRKYQPFGPYVNNEFYIGWLDYWGQPHERRDAEPICKQLETMLELGASINFYMFIGGTNFRFLNGADIDEGKFKPCPTSYDYDAALSEAGDPTEKYYAIQKVLQKFGHASLDELPHVTKKRAYGKVPLTHSVGMFKIIDEMFNSKDWHNSTNPLSMEELGQDYGYVLYRTDISSCDMSEESCTLEIEGLCDRAIVMVDCAVQGCMDRNGDGKIEIQQGSQLDIVVENQGRLCYAPKSCDYLPDCKGILGNVKLGGQVLEDWNMCSMDELFFIKAAEVCLRDLGSHDDTNRSNIKNDVVPGFYGGYFSIDEVADTFIKLDGWSKGIVLINGYILGRYWPVAGPQETLYVPKNLLKVNENTIVIFETDSTSSDEKYAIEFLDMPLFR